VETPPGLLARIDPDDLTEALGALLENAARHASGRVRVDLARAGDTVLVTVADDGPGIPEAQLARLTARGARLDTGGPGAGLGLAIASEIAEAAGGSFTLRNGASGLAARLRLPAAART
jgi:signal transduction histidine kinase